MGKHNSSRRKIGKYPAILLFVLVASGDLLLAPSLGDDGKKTKAVQKTVDSKKVIHLSGQISGKVQQVGFRALILKQAIRFNLTGTAKNNTDGTVAFVFQGDSGRIAAARKVIAQGTAKSSNVKVKTTRTKIDSKPKTFTVVSWTSLSRKITTPYNLVFTPRTNGKVVSDKQAHKEYHQILTTTLKGDDLKKVMK